MSLLRLHRILISAAFAFCVFVIAREFSQDREPKLSVLVIAGLAALLLLAYLIRLVRRGLPG